MKTIVAAMVLVLAMSTIGLAVKDWRWLGGTFTLALLSVVAVLLNWI